MNEVSTANIGWRTPTIMLGLLVVSSLILLFGFWEGINHMVDIWINSEEYGYGFFIPVISAYLIWQRRNILAQVEFRPSWLGVFVILVGGTFFFLGQIATTFTLVQYALVLCLLAVAYALMGWHAFKWVAGPLLLLFFVVPLPPFVYNNLSGKLQLISSEIGVAVIRLFGISVFLEGNVIDLGEYKLQVVEACSGLRYLFPLVSIAFLAAYMYKVEMWKRVLVFLSSIPITILMNSFRIGVIGYLVENYGTEQAEGFLHDFEGWIIFMACFAILLLEMTLLAKVGKRKYTLKEVFGLEAPQPLPAGLEMKHRPITPVHYGILASVALIALSSVYIQVQGEVRPPRADFSGYPLELGTWQGKGELLESIYLDSLKLDDYLLSDYRNDKGEQVNFYIAYYASQQAGSAAHSPRACIPGGGWQISDVTTKSVDGVTVAGQPLSVNRIEIRRGEIKQLVYYWFQQRGRVITNEYMTKWYLFLDGLTKHRTDGALVRLTTVINPGERWSDGDARLRAFALLAVPALDRFVPE
ncbi:MAG: VPLPA-CTERM-specific exosortase XrtD [Chromatiaceae bacterium]|nr:VPLPA-CTERM-specific exosortase XrtD [Gammaproteobacteria bacterium]MCP5445372.1 VPLPA-CTERM-specific exosortase XrtD [Chromatiaceae bacterium]